MSTATRWPERHDNIAEWERVMGRSHRTAAKVELGLSIHVDGMTVKLNIPTNYHEDKVIPKNLIARMTGTMKPPRAKRKQPVKLATLRLGQRHAYDRAMETGRWA